MRLNVYLQKAGIGSRREAERLVAEGRVAVNGAAALATTPVNDGDSVTLNGAAVAPDLRAQPRLFMLNKPLDVLVTGHDPQGRPTVFDLPALKSPALPRLMYVGRLDVNSEGLLLLSSDGPLAQALMSPANALQRVYRVRLRGRLRPGQLASLARGVTADGIYYRGVEAVAEAEATEAANSWYRIILREGKNREIRKLMEHFDCVVNRLIRVQYGPFGLDDLPVGAVKEVAPLKVKAFIDHLVAKGIGL